MSCWVSAFNMLFAQTDPDDHSDFVVMGTFSNIIGVHQFNEYSKLTHKLAIPLS